MKALVKTASGPGAMELRDLPDPVAGPGQVVMAVRAAALCGTDTHIARGEYPLKPPLVLGHELAGVVAAVGPGVNASRVGERITTETDGSVCGSCAFCKAGDQHLCPDRTAIGTTVDGGFAEYVVVPAAGVHRLPDHLDFDAGALTEPLAVAVRAVVERGAIGEGEDVVIVGPGTIGLLAAQVAMAAGATVTVVGLRRQGTRLDLARRMGVSRTAVLDETPECDALATGQDGLGVAVVVECTGAPDMIATGLGLLRKGGRLVQVGLSGGASLPLDLDPFVHRELSLVASRGKRPTSFRLAIDLLASGRVTPGALVTDRFELADWEAAFETAARSGTKVVLEIGPHRPAGGPSA